MTIHATHGLALEHALCIVNCSMIQAKLQLDCSIHMFACADYQISPSKNKSLVFRLSDRAVASL